MHDTPICISTTDSWKVRIKAGTVCAEGSTGEGEGSIHLLRFSFLWRAGCFQVLQHSLFTFPLAFKYIAPRNTSLSNLIHLNYKSLYGGIALTAEKKKQPKTQQAHKRDLLWSQLGQQCGSKSHEVWCWEDGVRQGTVTSDWTTTAKVKGKIFPLHLQMCFQCLVFWGSCLECWPVERFCLVTRAKGSCNCTYFSGEAQVLLVYLSSSSIDPGLLATARLARRASQRYR